MSLNQKENMEELEEIKKREKEQKEKVEKDLLNSQNKIYIPPIKMEAFLESETKQKLRIEQNRHNKREEFEDKEQRLKLNREIERRYFRQEELKELKEQKDNFYDKYQNPMHDGDDILIDTRTFKENRDSFDPYNREETIYEEKSVYNGYDNEYKENAETTGKTKRVEVIINKQPSQERNKREKQNKEEKKEKTKKTEKAKKTENNQKSIWDRERELER